MSLDLNMEFSVKASTFCLSIACLPPCHAYTEPTRVVLFHGGSIWSTLPFHTYPDYQRGSCSSIVLPYGPPIVAIWLVTRANVSEVSTGGWVHGSLARALFGHLLMLLFCVPGFDWKQILHEYFETKVPNIFGHANIFLLPLVMIIQCQK